MIEVTYHPGGKLKLSNSNIGEAWVLSEHTAQTLLDDLNEWLKDRTTALSPSTPPDPALLLAQRIARISAETGLKPNMVFRIINQLNWEAKEAHQAEAPQENPTDG